MRGSQNKKWELLISPGKSGAPASTRKCLKVVNLAIWGEVTPGAILTKRGLWGDMVDVITCATFGDFRLRGVWD